MAKVDIYICSKPLQYLNICNTPMHGDNKKILIICDAFYKSYEFSQNIRKYEKQWDRVFLVSGRKWVFPVLKYKVDKLFFGLDSTIVGILHLIKKFKFYLYEEGAGIYNSGNVRIQKKYRLLAKLLGTGEVIGKSKYLEGIYVYYPSFYISKIQPSCPVHSFKMPYRDVIKQNVNRFLKLYDFDANRETFLNIKDSKILLYLTDWEYQTSTIERMKKEKHNYDYLFIKPHPHIRIENIPVIEGVEVLYTTLVVEMIIQVWIENNNEITVYHQDSTAVTPFGNEINSINVSETNNTEYHKIIEELKNLSCQ